MSHRISPELSKRESSGPTRRKSNQPSGPSVSANSSRKPGSKAMPAPSSQKTSGQAQVHNQKKATAAATCSSTMINQRNSYDAARISQWAAQSANGPSHSADFITQEQTSFGYMDEQSLTSAGSQMSERYAGLHADILNDPSHFVAPEFEQRLDMCHNTSTASAGNTFATMDMNERSLQNQGFTFPSTMAGDGYVNGLSSSLDCLTYPASISGDFYPFEPMNAHLPVGLGDSTQGTNAFSPWSASGLNTLPASHPLDWSPDVTLTPSSSSMQSSNSLMGHQPDTPVSTSMYEGIFPAVPHGSLDGDNGVIPPFSSGENIGLPSSINYTDPESTIRPAQNFQRASIPTMDMWTGQDVANQPFGIPHVYKGFDTSRRSIEGETKNARDHAYYKATPGKDGLYHCPFAAKENCVHKAEKLKCNYDKHLDSHLKPYRCKSYGCSQIQFSSTACLLRHEREAHGMHGHGPKPHLCYFKDCDRAQEDNGFPRRWNLFDHMKRVHDFAGTEPSTKSDSPSPPSSGPQEPPKKKRTPSPTAEAAAKRVKYNNSGRSNGATTGHENLVQANPTPVEPEYQTQSLDQMWYTHVAQVQARLQSLDPTDPRQWQQYQKDTETLQTISMTMQFQQAQLAY